MRFSARLHFQFSREIIQQNEGRRKTASQRRIAGMRILLTFWTLLLLQKTKSTQKCKQHFSRVGHDSNQTNFHFSGILNFD